MLRSTLAAAFAGLVLALGCAGVPGTDPPAPRSDAARAPADPQSDPRVAWLRRAAVPIRSVDPADEDFTDLEPLRRILAGRRVVILGEATHGDGRTFLAKSRLVRFLHRELGFRVLAFESGFYDCWKARGEIEAGADPDAAFRRSVFPIWTRSVQVQDLIQDFAAAARSERPLVLAGFDPQFTGELSERHLLEDLAAVAEAVGTSGEALKERIGGTLANVVHARYEAGELPSAAERADFLDALAELEERLRDDGRDVPERAFWLRLLESTRDHAVASWNTDWSRSVLESPEEYEVRERLMGEQLAWLARERFPGEKIVAWMHMGHAVRGLDGVEVPSPVHARLYRTLQPAGAVARAALGDELYTVAFVAYEGEYRIVFRESPPVELLRPTEGSLEDLFHRTGLEHAFLDLSQPRRLPPWLRGRLIARPVGYKEMRARWHTVFDGVVFLDRMTISERVGADPRSPGGARP